MDFAEYLTFQRTEKFTMADFYEIDFMKGIPMLAKVDEMFMILKSLLTNRFWLRVGIGWLKFLLKSVFRLLRPCFTKGKASSPCHDFLLLFFHRI